MSDFPPDPDDFDAAPIKVLYWPECIQTRPDMYVGNVRDGSGLHNMIEVVVADALVRGPCEVGVRADGWMVVTDDGAAFPFTRPCKGSMYGEGGASVHGSIADVEVALAMVMFHGTGSRPVVNALSSRFSARLWRDGGEHVIAFEEGNLVAPLARLGPAPLVAGVLRRGNEISFLAAASIFGATAYDRTCVSRRLRRRRRRHPEARVSLGRERGAPVCASLDFSTARGA